MRIVNAGGSGAITSFTGIPDPADGISVVQVAGMSTPGAFTLPGGYVTGGTPFEYNLYAYGPGSPNGNAAARAIAGWRRQLGLSTANCLRVSGRPRAAAAGTTNTDNANTPAAT